MQIPLKPRIQFVESQQKHFEVDRGEILDAWDKTCSPI